MIQDVKAGDVEASAKMRTFLRALKGGIKTCPIVQRSLDIINNSLHSPLEAQPSTTIELAEGTMRNYLPAFPYRDMEVDYNVGTFGATDLDAFSMLDCFPENHIVGGTGEWYVPH